MFPKRPMSHNRRSRAQRFRKLDLECLEIRATPATFTVTSLDDVVNPGDDSHAFTLREAINAANLDSTADTIVFDPLLTAEGPEFIYLSGTRLRINSSVTIQGPTNNPLAVSGSYFSQVFYIDGRSNGAATVVIRDLFIGAGLADGTLGTTVAGIDNSVRGGNLFNDSATVTLERVYMPYGEATYGSSIYNQAGNLTLRDSTISDNLATGSAAITNDGGTMNIIQSTVAENDANGAVGGIQNLSGTLNIIQSTIANNSADNENGEVNYSGGINTNANTTTVLINSIVTGNTVYSPDSIDSDIGGIGSLDVANSHHNLIGSLSAGGLADGVNGNIIREGLNFYFTFNSPLQLNGGFTDTYLLSPPYPFFTDSGLAVDNGDSSIAAQYNLTYDQRGLTRVLDNAIDIGAVEYGTYATSLDLVSAPVPSRFGQVTTFTATVLTPNGVATGDVRFAVDGNLIGTATIDGSGQATFTTTSLAVGTHTVLAYYLGDTLYDTSYDLIDIAVVPPKLEVDNLSDVSDGNWNPGQLTLREAIEIANMVDDLDEITFAIALTYFNPVTINVNNTPLSITSPVNIVGPGTDKLTISGQSNMRIVSVDGSQNPGIDVHLQKLTLANGSATNGGALVNDQGNVTLSDFQLLNNQATVAGGAIVNNDLSTLRLERGNISGNSAAGNGGVIWNGLDASVYLDQLLLSNNSAADLIEGGGVVYNGGGQVVMVNTFVQDSSATLGGVVYNEAGSFTSVNNTFFSNDAATSGGAIYTSSTDVNTSTLLINSLFVANTGNGLPSDIDGLAVATGSSNNLISSPLAAGNLTDGTDGNIVGKDDGAGGKIPFAVDDIFTTAPADNGGPVPTFALATTSPAINAGITSLATVDGLATSAALTTDQRGTGFARVQGTAVDIGAYELDHFIVSNPLDEDDTNYATGDLSLREAIRLANTQPGPALITFAANLGPVELNIGGLTIDDAGAETRISGPQTGTQTIARGTAFSVGKFSIFQINADNSVILDHLQLRNGDTDLGGGIFSAGNLSLENSILTLNHATSEGGGIYSTGDLQVIGSVFSNNTADLFGGGLSVLGPTSIISTSIYGNQGSGVVSKDSLEVVASSIWNNQSTVAGGGIHAEGSMLLVNTTVSGNSSTLAGGGVYLFHANATMVNNTIVNNHSAGNEASLGGGLAVENVGETVDMVNSIIAGNTLGSTNLPSDIAATDLGTSHHNLIGDPASAGGLLHADNGNILGKDDGNSGRVLLPLKEILQTNLRPNGGTTHSHALLPNSPAIDAGDNSAIAGYDFDQRGEPFTRIFDGPPGDSTATVDLGAIEFGGAFQNEDLNEDGAYDIADIVTEIYYYKNYAFPNGGNIPTADLPTAKIKRADVNHNGTFDLSDILRLIFVYKTEGKNGIAPPIRTQAPNPAPTASTPPAENAVQTFATEDASAATPPVGESPTAPADDQTTQAGPSQQQWDAALLLALQPQEDEVE